MWWKVVNVKFVENLMPEILVPNLYGSKHYDPGKARSEKWPGLDRTIFVKVSNFFKWSYQADFGANRQENVKPSALSICPKVIPGFSGSLWPAKLKNGHFWKFFDFSANKKYANVKIEGCQIKGLSTSFPTIPKLCGLDWAALSYNPGGWWKTRKLCTNVIWCTDKIN